MDIEITELTTLSPADLKQLCKLLQQLSARLQPTEEHLRQVVESPTTYIYVAREVTQSLIVGCASLCVFEAPSARKASIEDVVVLEECRSRGIGRMLVEHVIEAAQEFAPIEVQLTSAPKRVAANALYRQMGFEPKETNVYRMVIDVNDNVNVNDNDNDNEN